MPKINFFTAITYQTPPKNCASKLLENVDDYFYLGGKKAHVLQGEKVVLSEAKVSLLARIGKIFSYFTVIVPLMMLIAKAILRSQHSFKVIDPKQKLEEGMSISEATAAKIQELIPKIIKREKDENIEWQVSGNLVFRLKGTPNIVFKMGRPGVSVARGGKSLDSKAIIDERFANMVKAKGVCLAKDLGLLRIPHARKFEVNVGGVAYTLIAEEYLDVNPHESAQEELYRKVSTDLNETALQLAIFVAKTGFNDVIWRNIPIMNEAAGFHGPRRVALIDLEHMESAKNGFLGDYNGSRGLIRCVSEEQIDTVIAEAKRQGIEIPKEAKIRRLQELEDDKQLHALYARKGIVTGKEPLQVDLDSLGLDLNKVGQISVLARNEEGKLIKEGDDFKHEEQNVTLRKVTEDVIAEINKNIQSSSDRASTKGKRYLVLNTNKRPFKEYEDLGWLPCIIPALADKGHLFKLDKVNGRGYFIQA